MSDKPCARWTPHPVVEREIANEEREGRTARARSRLFAIIALGLCPCSLSGLIGSLLDGHVSVEFAVITFVMIAFFVESGRRASRQAERERRLWAEFCLEYASVAGWIVELTIFQGATPTGRDRGVIWFENDRLTFSGRRTSFALAPGQVRASVVESGTTHDLGSILSLPLKARTAAGGLSVGLDILPLDAPFAPAGQDQRTFLKAARGWLAAGGSAEGQLPPFALGPDAPSGMVLLAQAALGTCFWVLVALGLVALGLSAGWGWPIVLGIVLVVVVAFSPHLCIPRLRWRAWRDRRRLERAQWKT